MKLSAFSVLDSYPEFERGERDRFAELLSFGEAADAAGLDGFWVAEHHFHEGGICPSPPVLLAALGQRTHSLRLGALVAVLPFHSAIDIAEQYALVDHLVGGRLNFGVGSGYIPLEFGGFGIDPAEKRERFDLTLSTVLSAWAGSEVRAEPPGATSVRLNVRPVQRPHPPIWVAVQRREALPFLARAGRSIALIPYATLDSVPELATLIREYRKELPSGSRAEVAAAVHVYAGPDPEKARHHLQRYLESRLATQSANYEAKVRRDPRHASVTSLEESGFALLGTPGEVVERAGELGRAGVDELLGIFDFGGLPAASVNASVKALGAAWTARDGRG
ncbi:MAG: LLM class flavin-dependent oxidoreductase [Thermoplasmata archaeon]|nr:LLM class flavin-dependent oxidoreductase [Thermoplasmata archaeon]